MPRSLSWAQERWCILYHSCPFLSSLCWIKSARSLFVYNHLILSFACSILPFWWKERRKWKSFRCVWLSVTPQTIQSMEFSRQEYWREKTFPSPRDLPNPGTGPAYLALVGRFFPLSLKLYTLNCILYTILSFPDSSVGKESAYNADPSSIPGSGRSTGEGIGYPRQYSWASLMAQLVKNLPAM